MKSILFRLMPLTALAGLGLLAAPSLTTIQDVVYRADGSLFSGTAIIQWKAFQAADATPIGASEITVQIKQGRLSVRLVPTLDSIGGAFYTVRYQSEGRFQFSEIWAVPSTASILKIKDVKVPLASGLSGGGGAVSGTLTLSDITGLQDELDTRVVKGPNFTVSRAAVIDNVGNLAAVQGSPSDCVRVDGTSTPCGSTGGGSGNSVVFVDLEAPVGLTNGVNRVFDLSATPVPASSLHVYRNGLLLRSGLDYLLAANRITFVAAATPQAGDSIVASYRK